MSYVISSSQRLATEDNRIKPRQLSYEVDGAKIKRHNVGFGQPLYPLLSGISSYTTTREEGINIPILPDCGVRFIFIRREEECESYVCGPTYELKKINIGKDDLVVVGQFIPGCATPLLKCPVGEIVDRARNAMENIHGGNQMTNCFSKPMVLDEQIKLIGMIMRTYLLKAPRNELVEFCIERIYETDGNIKIDGLASEAHVTARNINKLFEKYVGISPKYCVEIVKTIRAIARIIESPDEQLTNIAAECGYFDHAHMNKTFKKLLYCSSGKIRKSMFDEIDYSVVKDLLETA